MPDGLPNPKVTDLAWGRIGIEGFTPPFRDAKVFPGGAREWDWNETGTSHSDGILPGDVQELIDRGATTIVLGTGVFGRLKVHPDTLALLDKQGIAVVALRTGAATRRYNELAESEPGTVGGLFHTTC
jgi:hypothetical protein